MRSVVNITRLHLNKPMSMFGVPAMIIALVLVITMIISFALQRAGLDPASPEYAEGARSNFGMMWSLPGFLVYYGVQAVSTTLPFGLALGATRRSHVAGTALANLLLAAYVSLTMLLLLGIELATGHWFFGVYALDNYAFGSGNPWVLLCTVFLGVFFCTSVGGYFGAVWVRYGSKGPTIVALILALVLVLLLLIFVPQLAEIFEAITRPLLALCAVILSAACLMGTWLALRGAAVR